MDIQIDNSLQLNTKLENIDYRKNLNDYLQDIFSAHGPCAGYVSFRMGKKRDSLEFYTTLNELESNIYNHLPINSPEDIFFSFSTFNKTKHNIDSIVNICAWSIDVDYKNDAAKPLDVYHYIMNNVSIPTPNYVEYGHKLRLIYIFKEPLRLFKKQKRKLLNGFNFMQRCFSQMINEELGFGESFGAEANPACSFFRVPGSINSKDGSIIKICPISDERYTLQELFEDWIPNRYIDASFCKNDWYKEWKKNKKNKKKDKCVYSAISLWEYRKKTFLNLRNTCKHRKRLLFWYAISLLQIDNTISSTEMEKELLEFNAGFSVPLADNELKTTFKWITTKQKLYKATDAFLAEQLEISSNYFNRNSKKERDAKRYKIKKETLQINGKTKAQQIMIRQKNVEKMLCEKISMRVIADKLGVSLATIKRDAKEIKRRMAVKTMKYTRSNSMKKNTLFVKTLYNCFKESVNNIFIYNIFIPEGYESPLAFGAADSMSYSRRYSGTDKLLYTRSGRASPIALHFVPQ